MLGLASRITNLVEVTSRYLELPCKIYGEREDVRLKLRELHKELSQASTTVEEPSLWIDSICIGQRDYAERRKQDSQMNQIFCGYSSGRRFENRRERLAAFRAIAGDCNRSLKELDRVCVMEESRPNFQMLMIQTEFCNTSLRNCEPNLTCTYTREMRTKQEAANQ
jgi:hypothetical protein